MDDGSFDLRQVPPGSYRLLIFSHSPVRRRSQPGEGERIGGETRIDVDGHPLEVLLTLHRAVDIQGRVEIERGNERYQQVDPKHIFVQLVSDYSIGNPRLRPNLRRTAPSRLNLCLRVTGVSSYPTKPFS